MLIEKTYSTTSPSGVTYDWHWEPARTRTVRVHGLYKKFESPGIVYATAYSDGAQRALLVFSRTSPVADESDDLRHVSSGLSILKLGQFGYLARDRKSAVAECGMVCMPDYIRAALRSGQRDAIETFWHSGFQDVPEVHDRSHAVRQITDADATRDPYFTHWTFSNNSSGRF